VWKNPEHSLLKDLLGTVSIAITSRLPIFQRNQFAEKGDRSIIRVGDRPRRRRIPFGDAVE
jgi:hypothetical protein